jgi:hypothetical protein
VLRPGNIETEIIMTSNNSQTLVKALGVTVGEIAFGVNGPFFFERFGLNVPEAVATAVVIGAALGYGTAAMLFWASHREHVATPVRAVRLKPHQNAA